MLPIEAVRKGGLLTLTLCRPSALNALTTDMCGIIQEHLKISYSALVVKGGRGANGRSIFCAGGDVKQIWTQVKRGHKATGFFQSECNNTCIVAHEVT
jgi:enoyl-CoA hydratase/carnithine racemase